MPFIRSISDGLLRVGGDNWLPIWNRPFSRNSSLYPSVIYLWKYFILQETLYFDEVWNIHGLMDSFAIGCFIPYCCSNRVGLIIPKLEQTKAGEMVSSYDYISHFNCFRQHIGVTAFYSEALLVYVVKNSSCM